MARSVLERASSEAAGERRAVAILARYGAVFADKRERSQARQREL
jgi:hypothetical protein